MRLLLAGLSVALIAACLATSMTAAGGPFDFKFQELAEGVYVAIRPESIRALVEGNSTIMINDRDVVVYEGDSKLLGSLFKNWFVTPLTLSTYKEAKGEPII